MEWEGLENVQSQARRPALRRQVARSAGGRLIRTSKKHANSWRVPRSAHRALFAVVVGSMVWAAGFTTSVAAAPPAQRIVSTAPSITEILYALGLGNQVVGVSTYCHHPPEVLQKPKVGTFLNPNLELILSLRPDLVIAGPHQLRVTAGMKLNVLEVRHDTIPELHGAIESIGAAAGVSARARELSAKLRRELEEIRRRTATKPPIPMMFIVGRTPGRLEGMVAVGKASYLNELITIAGGRNIFADAAAAYPKVSMEEILARDPAVIIDMGDMAETVGVTEAYKSGVVQLWQRAATLRAVKQGRVHAVASDELVVPGPRVAVAAREFARLLHPELNF
jgi:iron complex transport system substrate-binding protein